MIQSGILTTIDSTTGQSTGVPVRGAWINFVQNNVTKATVQTNVETGAYSVDVPLGKYMVKIAVGDVTGTQRAGQLFELKTGDKADAFHKWLYSETGSIDDDLLKQFKQISNDINASANRAENAEKGAKQIENSMSENGYVKTKDATLAYLFGNPANGLYKTQDNDPNFIGLTPLSATNAYVSVHNYFAGNSSYVKLEWTYSGATQGKRKFVILKTNNAWDKPVEILKGQSIGDSNGSWMKEGAHGFGGITPSKSLSDILAVKKNSMSSTGNESGADVDFRYRHIINMNIDNSTYLLIGHHRSGMSGLITRSVSYGNSKDYIYYHNHNTAVDSNGFIKKASPIIKLFDDHIEWNQDFKEDPIFEKVAPGTYKISNTHGLAREGWTYEKPRGKDGNTYFKIKVQKLDDGCIVSVHDYFIDYEDVTIIDDVGNKRTVKKQIEVLSQARDIKAEERWIDLRFFEKIYDLTNEPPVIHVPYHPLWGVDPYIPPVVEQIEEDIALLD